MNALEILKQKLLARAAQRLAHDLNNDLTVIQAQTELISRQPELPPHERLGAIRQAADQLRRRGHSVIMLGQLNGPDTEPVSLSQALTEIEQLSALLVGKQARVQLSTDRSSPSHVDQGQLRLLAAGLLLAAVDSSLLTTGTLIQLTLSASPEPHLAIQAEGSRGPNWIALLRDAADSPELSLQQWPSGWEVSTPLRAVQAPDPRAAPAAATRSWKPAVAPLTRPVTAGQQPTLLVVDDEADVRYVLVQALKRQYQVVDAANMREALARLESLESLHMLVTDASLEDGESGISLAAEVRERWPGLPVVVVSGMPQEEDEVLPDNCLWLEKPVSLRTLRDSVERLLQG